MLTAQLGNYQRAQCSITGLWARRRSSHIGENVTGVNVIGLLKGRNFNTPDDSVVGVTAHHDTIRTTPEDSGCKSGQCGLQALAREWLPNFWPKTVNCILVLDSILNFDDTKKSQNFTATFKKEPLFSQPTISSYFLPYSSSD
ncbi:hypothetical protein C0Q70_00133 [Pomacea canaliculata]|uniref:Peptidase M28 domain-containing protein n=1 Tax=Pomacea canaliculata TaxID=400727 RepID=A0A2T7PVV2_POMCA|nr:hypothetical protein C0Q70_00133 [Pomacea canaliculata]